MGKPSKIQAEEKTRTFFPSTGLWSVPRKNVLAFFLGGDENSERSWRVVVVVVVVVVVAVAVAIAAAVAVAVVVVVVALRVDA